MVVTDPSYETIRYEIADRVLTITLDRPEHRNTVTYQTLDEMIDAFDRAQDDDDIRVVVLTGAGEFFSAGTDLSAASGGYAADAPTFKPLRGGTRDVGGELALRMFASNKALIGAINGTASRSLVKVDIPNSVPSSSRQRYLVTRWSCMTSSNSDRCIRCR